MVHTVVGESPYIEKLDMGTRLLLTFWGVKK